MKVFNNGDSPLIPTQWSDVMEPKVYEVGMLYDKLSRYGLFLKVRPEFFYLLVYRIFWDLS